jgi:hypothetical protein
MDTCVTSDYQKYIQCFLYTSTVDVWIINNSTWSCFCHNLLPRFSAGQRPVILYNEFTHIYESNLTYKMTSLHNLKCWGKYLYIMFKFVHDYMTHSFSEDLGKIIPAYILVNTVMRKQTVQKITMNQLVHFWCLVWFQVQ